MTTREFYNAVLSVENINDELKTKAEELIASLDKKNAKRTSADSKEKQATSARRSSVYIHLNCHKGQWFNRDEIAEALAITPNQVTAACTALAKDGLVQKTEIKVGKSRKTVYTVAEESSDEEDSEEDD